MESSPSEWEQTPMWLVKVSDFMAMAGPPPPFEICVYKRLLVEWQPGFFVIFVSHEWLDRYHPDGQGHLSHCLRMALMNILTGSLVVDYDCLAKSLGFNHKMTGAQVDRMANGYIWMDWMCLPLDQIGNHLECRLQLFVARSSIFLIAAPRLHNSRKELCSYESYGKRGWCRAEIWLKQMGAKPEDIPIILVTGDETMKFLRAHSWVYDMAHEGCFSVESDRELLKPVLQALLQSKLEEFLSQGRLHYYRYFKSRFERIVGLPVRNRSLADFLADFKFDEKSLRTSSGIGPVACAVLSDDLQLLSTLLEKRANLRCRAPNMLDIDIISGLTPLQLAAKHSCDPSAIRMLVELRANVNETDALGTSVVGHSGTKEVARTLIELRADVNQRKGPFGMPSLSACILRPLEPEGLELLIEARAHVNIGRGMYSFSPLTTASLFREMPRSEEIVRLLLGARADVNYREGFYSFLNRMARALCLLQRNPPKILLGIAECNGGTPLFNAAWFGNPEMVNRLLEARADPELRNHRGRNYLDALNEGNYRCGATSMSWQLQGQQRHVADPEALVRQFQEDHPGRPPAEPERLAKRRGHRDAAGGAAAPDGEGAAQVETVDNMVHQSL